MTRGKRAVDQPARTADGTETDAMTGGSNLRGLGDLPMMPPLVGANWGSFADEIFSRDYQGPRRLSDKSIGVYRNSDLRSLMTISAVDSVPAPVFSHPISETIGANAEGWESFLTNNIFTMLPPLRAPVRQILARQLTPGQIVKYQALADRVAREILAETMRPSVMDFQDAYAGRVTARFWRCVIGLNEREEEALRNLPEQILLGFGNEVTPDEARTADQAAGEYMEVLSSAILRECRHGRNQMLSEMAAEFAEIDLHDKPKDLGHMLASNILDGSHTVKVAISNAVYCLLESPDAKEELDADPTLIRNAVRESLRLYSPAASVRYCSADVLHGDIRLPEGTLVLMLWPVGNRDPEVFADPSRFDLHRPLRQAAPFGGGAHVCPGRNITAMLTEAVLRMWIDDRLRITLDGPVEWDPVPSMSRLKQLPVTIKPYQ
jgi:cytochrome P450